MAKKKKGRKLNAVDSLLTPSDLLPAKDNDSSTENPDDGGQAGKDSVEDVREVRDTSQSGGSAVRETRTGASVETGERGVSGADVLHDGERAGETVEQSLLNFAGATGDANLEARLSRILRQMLTRHAPEELAGRAGATNAEVLAETVMRKALEGNQWAIAFVSDRIEGRPGNVAPDNVTDADVEAELDRVTVHRLNKLTANLKQEEQVDE